MQKLIKFGVAINVLALIAVIAPAMSGCGGDGAKDKPCTVTKFCPDGTYCHSASGLCLPESACDACDTTTQVCYKSATCIPRCANSGQCLSGFYCDQTVGGCLPESIDGDTTDTEPDVDVGPCAGACAGSQLCHQGPGDAAPICMEYCNPYAPACSTGQVCWLPMDPIVGDNETGLCHAPVADGLPVGSACNSTDKVCQLDLVCWDGLCAQPCDAWNNGVCPQDMHCDVIMSIPMGLCVALPGCDTILNPCPSSYACVEEQCVPGTGCSSDAECPSSMVCQFGVCIEHCLYRSCPSYIPVCDTVTGHCVLGDGSCGSVGCAGGTFCYSGRCYPNCDPTCSGRQYCAYDKTSKTTKCVSPPDCRLGQSACTTVQDCDLSTGFCISKCPTSCPGGTCCDTTSNYVCGNCQSQVCSTLNPTGPCALMDQKCVNGQCHTDTSVCVPAGMACSKESRCCDAAADATVSCCINPSNAALGGICCGAGQQCLLLMCL